MESKTHIRVKDLSVWYGGHQALKDITVDIPDGQITAIIGPSGCGKTTLLKSFNRLIELQDEIRVAGSILVDGEDINDPHVEVTHLRKKMGLLLQRPQVLPMSIFENAAYGPRIHGVRDRNELDRIVEKYLKMVGLWDEVKDRLRWPASRLSVGQQQRLCLARGLAVDPEIILCDEPTSALDPVSAQLVERLLLALRGEYTIVVVTHNIHQAMRLADYVVHLYLGELVEHGPARLVFENPREERTRAYINGTLLPAVTPGVSIDAELNLKGTKCPYNFINAKEALHTLAEGKILRIIVDDPTAPDALPRGMEADGHKVLGVKPINTTDYEIIVQK